MNPKQQRFAEEYVVDHNATQAAKRADLGGAIGQGSSYDSAGSDGSERHRKTSP